MNEKSLVNVIRERGRIKQRSAAPKSSSSEAQTLHRAAASASDTSAPMLVPISDPNNLDAEQPTQTPENLDVYDPDRTPIILSSGGDGTFLLAASLIPSPDVFLLGLNTDPERWAFILKLQH